MHKTEINMTAIAALLNMPWRWYPNANFGAGTLLQNGTDRVRVDQAVTLMRGHDTMRSGLRKFLDALNLSRSFLNCQV